jgi:hypothetical protein
MTPAMAAGLSKRFISIACITYLVVIEALKQRDEIEN